MGATLINKLILWSHVISFVAFVFSADFRQTVVFGEDINVVSYLSQFGYLPPEYQNSEVDNLITNETLNSALVDFQTFNGLNGTGVADNETLELMARPRCGVADKVWRDPKSENYNLAYEYYRWNTTNLTYCVLNISAHANFTKEEFEKVIKDVFDIWSNYTPLIFTKKCNQTPQEDIPISFANRTHGDNYPFDGPSGVLAHAFYPGTGIGGDAHFDDEETWIIYNETVHYNMTCTTYYCAIEVDTVALHEFGHALGLNHSSDNTSIMYAFYSGCKRPLHLGDDDVKGIQAIYGDKNGTKPNGTTNTSPTTASQPPICKEALDNYTIFVAEDYRTYILSGYKYWEITYDMVHSETHIISQHWPYLSLNVDAAFVFRHQTYFLTGWYIWIYSRTILLAGYPRLIYSVFPSVPANVDTALVWHSCVYIFKDGYYWKYRRLSWKHQNKRYYYFLLASKDYPKSIYLWSYRLPLHIEAALFYRGYYYFFSGVEYYKYDDQAAQIVNDPKPYPRPMYQWWLHCNQSKSLAHSKL